jgi:hypothetical protein
VSPIMRKGRGRPPRDWRVAAKVAASLPEIGPKKVAEWLQKNHPYRVRAGEVRSAEAGPRRAKGCLEIDAARKAAMVRPGAADDVYRSPEERLGRLERLISHYVGLAYEQWLVSRKRWTTTSPSRSGQAHRIGIRSRATAASPCPRRGT